MLHFYLSVHQNAFGGQAPPYPQAGLRGRGVGKRKGREGEGGRGRGKKERGGPARYLKCIDANV